MIKHNFKADYQDWDAVIEQSPVTSALIEHTPLTKYSNKAVINLRELVEMWDLLSIEQNRSEKRIAGKKNRW